MAPKLDTVILATGDGDFVPLVEYLKYHGLQVEVAAFRGTTATKLVEAADSFTDLSEMSNEILIGGPSSQTAPTRGTTRGRKPVSAADREPITDF